MSYVKVAFFPHCFLYTNTMIKKLNEINTGYCINENIINNLYYEVDTVLFSQSLKGLELLINCCEEFAIALEFDIYIYIYIYIYNIYYAIIMYNNLYNIILL